MQLARMRTEPTGTALPVLAQATWDRLGDELITVFEGRRWTAAQLGERSRRLAGGLRELGVRPGDRVVVCMANCPEVGVAYHGSWRAGAVVTPVLFLLSEDELRHVLIDSGARLALTTPEFLPKMMAAAVAAPELLAIVVVGEIAEGMPEETRLPVLAFDELEAGPEAPLHAVDSTGLAALLYTGGTTGRAKGVMLSHDALSAAGWSATVTGVDEDLSVSLLPLPLAHVYGLMISTIQLHVSHPMTSVLMRWFDPQAWLQLVETERVNTSTVVPSMLRVLLDQPLERYDLSALRRLTSGSAPLPAEIRTQWARRAPHVEVAEGYGCTETAANISTSVLGQARDGSVGTVSPIAELAIAVEPASPPQQLIGVDGEICVRGPMLMSGYWKSPADTEATITGGWFHTGDVGHLDADGYLYIVDRIKDVIIRDGFNIYPRDVEEVLMSHPAVANCAVVGRPDERHGEEPVAFVQLHPDVPGLATMPDTIRDTLRDYAKAHLSAVKYPRDIRLIDQVPVTSVGKLDRKRLRAELDRPPTEPPD
ncbi:MAG: class I adenylate-forming enzyme family protein [Jatrophihabitans sp.]